jgi:flagellar hook protein FlgE
MALNAIFTAATGLAANAETLDVVGNNLANNNTTGYKSQTVLFKDLVYQTLNTGSGPTANQGAVNPSQIGFGVGIGSISSNFEQGTLTATGRSLDMGIQGNGFFVLGNDSSIVYSRAGAFNVDPLGFLVDPSTGMHVQRFGSVGETGAGAFQVAGDMSIRIPYGAGIPGIATSSVTMQGNLNAGMANGDSTTTNIQIYDTQGNSHALAVTFTKTANNTFSTSATISGGTATVANTPVTFDANGLLVSPATLSVALTGLPGPQTVTLQLGTPGQSVGLTQFGGNSTAAAVVQDGSPSGSLESVSVDQNGTLQGLYSNGKTLAVAQLAIARFNNEGGLLRVGNNYFSASPASGGPLVGTAGTGALGTISGGTLEGANVDIAQEFSRLILAQRGFQINSRVITVSNDVLQDLATIIR